MGIGHGFFDARFARRRGIFGGADPFALGHAAPQLFVFPALRFVLQKQHANRRRLQLRHWLLLALRCGLIAGLAIALARPTFQGTGLQGKAGAPLAVAMVVDNSLRMGYVQQNRTRLEEAIEMADQLAGQLPEDSQVAVTTLSRSADGFAVDLATAQSRLRSIEVESNPRTLAHALCDAISLVAQRKDYRQEVLLFSDLNVFSFGPSALDLINEALAEASDVRVYIVDVGVDQPSNAALGLLGIRQSLLRTGEPLHLVVPIELARIEDAPLVELYLLNQAGKPTKRGQQAVELSSEGIGQATFELANLPLGTHRGFVRLAVSDPLQFDNTRYFTVEVHPPAQVLLLGESPVDTIFLQQALQPTLARGEMASRFECDQHRFAEAVNLTLENYDAICLLNPPPLSEKLWAALADYTYDGGGLGIFLGHRAQKSAFNTAAAQRLLPGTLKWKSRNETYLRPRTLDHPALSALRNYAEEIPWPVYPVLQYWELEELAGDAHVIARFANSQPALLERSLGQGRVLTLATAISDPLQPTGRKPWNYLPTHPEPWPFVAMANSLVGYLAQGVEQRLNYRAGETASIRLAARNRVSSFVLYPPNEQPLRRSLPPGSDTILVSTTNALGNYRVASGGQTRRLNRGFSVNCSVALSNLARIDLKHLADSLPDDRVEFASTLSDVQRYVDIGRSGRELFSWAICLVAMVWSAEHLLSNRFYRGSP